MLRHLAFLKHISYAVLSLFLSVCALEVGLRVYDSSSGQLLTKHAGEEGPISNSWTTHHRLKPLRRWTTRNPDTGTRTEFVTNSFGLRGVEPEVPKPPGVYRIVCLGDENTLASEMKDAEIFCTRLQSLLQSRSHLHLEVINAGVPGYCPLLSYLQLKHSLLGLQPDLIVLNFDMSDIADDHRHRRHAYMDDRSVPLACPHPNLLVPHKPKPLATSDRFLLPHWLLQQLGHLPTQSNTHEDRLDIDAPRGRYAWLKDNPPDWSIYIRQAVGSVDAIHSMAKQTYAEFFVATYPKPWQVSAHASNGKGVRQAVGVDQEAVYRSRVPFEILANHFRERGINFLDTSTTFQQLEKPERLFLKNAPRFSRLGHELYARELARYILQNVSGIWSRDPYRPQQTEPQRQARSINR